MRPRRRGIRQAQVGSLYKKGAPQRELVDVNEIARETLALLRAEADRYRVSMRTDLAADLPQVAADRLQLQQVFMNLMLNGIEAMQGAGGELTVKSERGEDCGVLLSVSDTGMGLPADKLDAIFTTKPQGTGIGLAISRSIVDSHGGRLWATSIHGQGASFQCPPPHPCWKACKRARAASRRKRAGEMTGVSVSGT